MRFIRIKYILLCHKVSTITADNAANILAAFRIEGIDNLDGISPELFQIIEEQNEGDAQDENSDDEMEEDENEDDDWEDLNLDGELSEEEEEQMVQERKLVRNGCNSHLLQCAIKDSLNAVPAVLKLTKKVNEIVTFFHRSNFWYNKLRQQIKGLALLKPCTTRWNSLYHCLKRIFKPRSGIVSCSKQSRLLSHFDIILSISITYWIT